MPSAQFPRVDGLLGPIFEEAGTGERQMTEALFLTFNVDLGFFETRLLGPVRSTGAAVTVVADSSVFAPDPRSVRSAGHGYAFGLAAMNGAFHPKLTILAGPQRALIGIGSGNLTIGGWHANDEVLTTIRASREDGVPEIVGDVVGFLRALTDQVTISPLAIDGILRTADQLDLLINSGEPVATGHALVDSARGHIINQLPQGPAERLELSAPFHDLGGKALGELIRRYEARHVTILAQPGEAVMEPATLLSVAKANDCELEFVQLADDGKSGSRYRHGKVISAITGGVPAWSLTGSANLSAAALLGQVPGHNCELGVLSFSDRALLPTPTVPVADVRGLTLKIANPDDGETPRGTALPHFLEARAVDDAITVTLDREADADLDVDYMDVADHFELLGVLRAGESSALFDRTLSPRTPIRIADQIQFLAFPAEVVSRLRPVSSGTWNRDATVAEIFASDAAAAQWHAALVSVLLSHGQSAAGQAGAKTSPLIEKGEESATSSWRTLDDEDTWATYADDAIARLGMPIFQLALGAAVATGPVGASLPSTAPGWDDNFDTSGEDFDEGDTAETADEIVAAVEPEEPPTLSVYQRGRLRKWVADIVELMPQLGPIEQIAVAKLAITGTSASIWDSELGAKGWFDPLADAMQHLARDDWPKVTASQAGSVASIGLYRLMLALPTGEIGRETVRFKDLANRLGSLVSTASEESVTENLSLITDAYLVPRTAEDVMSALDAETTTEPRQALTREIEHLFPDAEVDWINDHTVVVTGKINELRRAAAKVLNKANQIPSIAIGVNHTNTSWVVVGRVDDRITVIDASKGLPTYQTYDVTGLNMPASVVAVPKETVTALISDPPLKVPGAVDLEVMQALGLTTGKLRP